MGSQNKVYMGNGGVLGVREVRRGGVESNAGWTKKSGKVYGLSGVSARAVLASGGIARGGVKRVGEVAKPKAVAAIPPKCDERASEMNAEEKRLADYLEVAQRMKKECDEAAAKQLAIPVSAESEEAAKPVFGLSEEENRAVESFEQMRAEKAAGEIEEKAEAEAEAIAAMRRAEEELAANECAELLEAVAKADESRETRAVLPELPLGDGAAKPSEGKRKRRRRRNRH